MSTEKEIGAMSSSVKYLVKTLDEVKINSSDTHDVVIKLESSLKSAHKRLDSHAVHIEDYKKNKHKGIGFISGISISSGAIGAFIAKLFNF